MKSIYVLIIAFSTLLLWGIPDSVISIDYTNMPYFYISSLFHESGHCLGSILTQGNCQGIYIGHRAATTLADYGNPYLTYAGAYIIQSIFTGLLLIMAVIPKYRYWLYLLSGYIFIIYLFFAYPGGIWLEEADQFLMARTLSMMAAFITIVCMLIIALVNRYSLPIGTFLLSWFAFQMGASWFGTMVVVFYSTDAFIAAWRFGGEQFWWAVSFVIPSVIIYSICIGFSIQEYSHQK